MAPPLPFFRSKHVSLARAGGQLIVRPTSGVDVFEVQRRIGTAGLHTLYLGEARVVATRVEPLADGAAVVDLEGAFYRESSGELPTLRCLGPLPIDEARGLAAAIDAALSLPRLARRITLDDLAHGGAIGGGDVGDLVAIEAPWETGLERSSMGHAWVNAPWSEWQRTGSGRSVRKVVGFYRAAPQSAPGEGFGHFGLWPAVIDVVTMHPPADVSHHAAGETS